MNANAYIPFKPISNDDPMLCAQPNCGKPLDVHTWTGHCPLPDGSGFSFSQHFKRAEQDKPFTDSYVRVVEFLSDSVAELVTDLEEIGR